ncbi:MAG TPA: DeoR/GlpR family DNA-binding transcription regulator [Thermohalobaculum sp.]|nr:DeoR/GlpR family DNA-binding transcription regulator [Thermohalobaculum sp.]
MIGRLSKSERQKRILGRLRSRVTVRILSLAEEFGVATETIRRDIDELAGQGLVSRTYGGAVSPLLAEEPGLLQREMSRVDERARIAARAADMVEPRDVLMIDSGSTTAQFARALAARRLEVTALTNGIAVARALAENAGARVILCPGDYRESELGVYGQETAAFLGRYKANKAFIGAGGITTEAVTDADSQACWIKRTMIERAGECMLLVDSGKFGADLFEAVCPLPRIDHVLTDSAPPPRLLAAIAKAKVRLHVAEATAGGQPPGPGPER